MGGAADRIRTGTARITASDAAVTPQPPWVRAGTTGLEPAAYRLTSERSPSELRPQSCAGGIRTHGLELMRLARTTAPPPRCARARRSGRQESNLRSPVPDTGGVADSPTTRRVPPGLELRSLNGVAKRRLRRSTTGHA